jgi:hypothetical protein
MRDHPDMVTGPKCVARTSLGLGLEPWRLNPHFLRIGVRAPLVVFPRLRCRTLSPEERLKLLRIWETPVMSFTFSLAGASFCVSETREGRDSLVCLSGSAIRVLEAIIRFGADTLFSLIPGVGTPASKSVLQEHLGRYDLEGAQPRYGDADPPAQGHRRRCRLLPFKPAQHGLAPQAPMTKSIECRAFSQTDLCPRPFLSIRTTSLRKHRDE